MTSFGWLSSAVEAVSGVFSGGAEDSANAGAETSTMVNADAEEITIT